MPRCFYEVLNVERTASQDEIRVSYRKLALAWHPDKNREQIEEATARFKEIQNAYEVLSDKNERSWYDSHRESIIHSDDDSPQRSNGKSEMPEDINLWSFFSGSAFFGYGNIGKGFYSVYGDVFDRIQKQELQFAHREGKVIADAPKLGRSDSPSSEVSAFYSYWTNFVTIKDFAWCDEYNLATAPQRKVRRLMEEENKKTRKKNQKKFNDEIRQLALYVKKRDKRVMEYQMEAQMEAQRLQREREAEQKSRKEAAQREKMLKAQQYVEQDWTKVDDDEEEEIISGWDYNSTREGETSVPVNQNDYYCIACGKNFKSEKQWKNHEKSKKHKEKLAVLRDVLLDEEEEVEEVEEVELAEEPSASHEENGEGRREVGDSKEDMEYSNGNSAGRNGTLNHSNNRVKDKVGNGLGRSTERANQSLNPETDEEDSAREEEDDEAILKWMLKTRHLQRNAKESTDGSIPATDSTQSEAKVEEIVSPEDKQSELGSDAASEEEAEVEQLDEQAETVSVGMPETSKGVAEGKKMPKNKSAARRLAKQAKKSVAHSGRHDAVLSEIKDSVRQSLAETHLGNTSSNDPVRLEEENGASVPKDEIGENRVGEGQAPVSGAERNGDENGVEVGGSTVQQNFSSDRDKGGNEEPGSSGKTQNGRRGAKHKGDAESLKSAQALLQRLQESKKQGGKKKKEKKGKVDEQLNTCGVCGDDFDSRNQLFKHISETGHTVPKQ